MRLTNEEFQKLVARRPSPVLGSVDSQKHSQQKGALVKDSQPESRRQSPIPKGHQITVSIVAYVRTRMDSDNLAGACKPLRDEIADYLGIDDGDERVRWEYGQHETRGETGCMVKVEV